MLPPDPKAPGLGRARFLRIIDDYYLYCVPGAGEVRARIGKLVGSLIVGEVRYRLTVEVETSQRGPWLCAPASSRGLPFCSYSGVL